MNRHETDPTRFNLDLECPHCGRAVIATLEAGPIVPRSPFHDYNVYLICSCPKKRCDPLLVIYDRLNNRVQSVFPYPEVSERRYHQAIPDPVKADLAEADACWYGGSNKGVVAMCRRALQQMAQEKGRHGNAADQPDRRPPRQGADHRQPPQGRPRDPPLRELRSPSAGRRPRQGVQGGREGRSRVDERLRGGSLRPTPQHRSTQEEPDRPIVSIPSRRLLVRTRMTRRALRKTRKTPLADVVT
jgi:hypothetical protein